VSGAGAPSADEGEIPKPSVFVRAGGVALAFAGLVALLVPVQLLTTMGPLDMWLRAEFARPLALVVGITVSGLGGLVAGLSFLRARGWAATLSIAVALGVAASSGAFVLWMNQFGVFLAMPLLSAAAGTVALLLCALGGPSVVRVALARERLRAAGLDLGR